MEHKTYTQQEIRKIENAKTAIGLFAVLSALYSIVNIIRSVVSFFQTVPYLDASSLFYNIPGVLSNLISIAAMIFCIIFISSFYGKKKSPLLVLSAFLITVKQIILFISGLLSIVSMISTFVNFGFYEKHSILYLLNVIIGHMVPALIIGILFVFIALSLLGKIKTKTTFLPSIALLVSLLASIISIVFSIIANSYFGFSLPNAIIGFLTSMVSVVLSLLVYVPFIIFAKYCPLDYQKGLGAFAPIPSFPQDGQPWQQAFTNQETQAHELPKAEDKLHSELVLLKNELKEGKITQQEYEEKTKNFFDNF